MQPPGGRSPRHTSTPTPTRHTCPESGGGTADSEASDACASPASSRSPSCTSGCSSTWCSWQRLTGRWTAAPSVSCSVVPMPQALDLILLPNSWHRYTSRDHSLRAILNRQCDTARRSIAPPAGQREAPPPHRQARAEPHTGHNPLYRAAAHGQRLRAAPPAWRRVSGRAAPGTEVRKDAHCRGDRILLTTASQQIV